MSTPLLLPHAAAIIDRLQDAGLTVGDHIAPKSSDGKIVAPCVVVYMRPGGTFTNSVGMVEEDAWLPFQLTCVGRVAKEALQQADRAHAALTESPITVADRVIALVRRDGFGSSVQRDVDVTPALFYAPVIYRLWTLTEVDGS